jgi:ABC-type polar amino acid transport system ATPase subunit
MLLRVENLHKSFDGLNVLNGISFGLEKGQVTVVIGSSGSGKSTLLRCINCLSPPDKGQVWLENQELTARDADLNQARSKMGFVFQDFNLFTHLTVLENVCFGPLRVNKKSKEEARQIALEEIKRVGMMDKLNAYPAQLSGGQQQRISIARALALKPQLIMFDEPTSALDPELTGEVLSVMSVLARDGMTLLVVTHEMGFARSVADRIIFMEEGVILEQGPPEQLFTAPENERTRYFLQMISQLE